MPEEQKHVGFVSIEPTPGGYQRIADMFQGTVVASELLIEYAEDVQQKIVEMRDTVWDESLLVVRTNLVTLISTHGELLNDALDALISQERIRIGHMHDGLNDLAKGGYTPTTEKTI